MEGTDDRWRDGEIVGVRFVIYGQIRGLPKGSPPPPPRPPPPHQVRRGGGRMGGGRKPPGRFESEGERDKRAEGMAMGETVFRGI
jgi:hypothetical protein